MACLTIYPVEEPHHNSDLTQNPSTSAAIAQRINYDIKRREPLVLVTAYSPIRLRSNYNLPIGVLRSFPRALTQPRTQYTTNVVHHSAPYK